MRVALPLSVLLCLLATGSARAEVKGVPRHRLHFHSLTAAQYNPLGVQTDLMLSYRYRLFQPTSVLFQDTFVGVGPIVRVNPAYARGGLGVELQPLMVLNLRAQWEFRGYYKTFGMIQSFKGAYSEHHDDIRKDREELEQHYATTGHQVNLQATLRAKVGPWAVVNDLLVSYFKMDVKEGDTVFYDALTDMLTPADGVTVTNNAHLFFQTGEGLTVGLRYTVAHGLYSDEALGPDGVADAVVTPTHRLGPMFVYEWQGRGERFHKPTLAIILNWWLRHRYRTGQKVNRGIPWVAVAFFFTGDLWSSK